MEAPVVRGLGFEKFLGLKHFRKHAETGHMYPLEDGERTSFWQDAGFLDSAQTYLLQQPVIWKPSPSHEGLGLD